MKLGNIEQGECSPHRVNATSIPVSPRRGADHGYRLATLGPLGGLGFGGVAGAIVGYTAKKVTKLAALLLGAIFIVVQLLVYADIISVNWKAVQDTAQGAWTDPQGATLASRAWKVISGNLPFGGGFVAGFAVGFKLG